MRAGSLIHMSGIGLTYRGAPPVSALSDVDVDIARGEYVTVVGPSGSGKSTFLNILGLLDAPTAGVYRFAGHDVSALNDRDRTSIRGHAIGFVFQSFHLIGHRSATENVQLALLYGGHSRRTRPKLAREALEKVGLGHRMDALPARMSGGERQRVAIARAIVTKPDVLLCDEPTGNLDSRTAANILSQLDDLHREGMTVVVITHDRDVAARGERCIRISDGHLSEPVDSTLTSWDS
ncbi:ABC transporter ATP-binding protein [Leifsonia sp. WHRI 6310E]|uniref:ABC transporter ATP-binding protein n=1 Tax=Leifsonia sp. WHRI 6310E TaxID=3162562 RepID=UPI0035A8B5C4